MTSIPKTYHLDRRAARLAAEDPDGDPDTLLTTNDLAAWFGCSTQWLEIGRCRGYGPPFVRIGPRQIRYRRVDVKGWLMERTYCWINEHKA